MSEKFTTLECANCYMNFGITVGFWRDRRNDHKIFHCPAGHPQSFMGQSEEEKLRLERDRLKQQLAQKDDSIKYQREQREKAEKKVIAYKGIVTRTKNRIAGGVCPCCNRTFENLHRHMATKHKDYQKQEEVA